MTTNTSTVIYFEDYVKRRNTKKELPKYDMKVKSIWRSDRTVLQNIKRVWWGFAFRVIHANRYF